MKSRTMLSDLPDELLVDIVSLLTPIEFFATRTLSRRWRSLTPVLYLSDRHSDSKFQKSLECLSKQVVKRRSLSITLRNLSSKYKQSIEDLLPSIAKDVYELRFCCPNFRISKILYSNSSLAVLRLANCHLDYLPNNKIGRLDSLHVLSLFDVSFSAGDLDHLISISPNISHLSFYNCHLDYNPKYMIGRLDSSQFLRLYGVSFSTDDLHRLISISPNISHLSLCRSTGIEPLKLLDLSPLTGLKDVGVSGIYCEGIVTDAPNLRSLSFFSDCTTECTVVLRRCSKLEKLKLITRSPTRLCMEEIFSDCPLLEFVHTRGSTLPTPSYINNRGVTIWLDRAINTPNTYSLEYHRSYQRFVFIVKSEPQGKVMFRADQAFCGISTYCFEQLRALVEKAQHVSVLSLRFRSYLTEQDVDIGQLSSYMSPVRRIKHVKLNFMGTYGPFPLKSCENVVDAFLWCCFPETLTVKFGRKQSDFMEALCEKFKAKGKVWNTCCCQGTDFKCWRHFLEDVEIERCARTNKQGRSYKRIDIKFQWS